MKKEDDLGEDVVELVGKTLAAEDVYCTEVGRLHATEPHVCYVLHKKFLHLTTRVPIVEKHPGIIFYAQLQDSNFLSQKQ